MALWDIAAKEKGVPLVELLGGRAHDALPACASLHVNHPTIDDSVAAIKSYIDGGFRSAKLGLGKRGLSKAGRDPDYDVALVGALREAIGPTPDIMVDGGNGVRWDVETADHDDEPDGGVFDQMDRGAAASVATSQGTRR